MKNEATQTIKFVKYTNEPVRPGEIALVAGPNNGRVTNDSSQASIDWARRTEDYYVHGIRVLKDDQILDGYIENPEEFHSHHNLKKFFNEVLLSHINDLCEKQKLIEQCFKHLHQGGLPHAGNHGVQTKMAEFRNQCYEAEQRPFMLYGNPVVRVDFTAIPDGIEIFETSAYPTLLNTENETEVANNHQGYLLKVLTKSKLTANGGELLEVTHDCPDERLQRIFGSGQSYFRRFRNYLNILSWKSQSQVVANANPIVSPQLSTYQKLTNSVNALSKSLYFWTPRTTDEANIAANAESPTEYIDDELSKEIADFTFLEDTPPRN